jgi:hypothetical protein
LSIELKRTRKESQADSNEMHAALLNFSILDFLGKTPTWQFYIYFEIRWKYFYVTSRAHSAKVVLTRYFLSFYFRANVIYKIQ